MRLGVGVGVNVPRVLGFSSAEYQTVYDSLTTKPSTAIATAQNTMVSSLVSTGVWAKLDMFCLFAQYSNNNGEALLNWKDPTGDVGSEMLTNWNTPGMWDSIPPDISFINGGIQYTDNGVARSLAITAFMTSGAPYRTITDTTGIGRVFDMYDGTNQNNNCNLPKVYYNDYTPAGSTMYLYFFGGYGDVFIRNISFRPILRPIIINSPTFTSLEGFTGDAATNYINFQQFADFGNYSLDNCSMFGYIRNDIAASSKHLMGSSKGADFAYIAPRWTGTTKVYGGLNDAGGANHDFTADTKGFFAIRRTDAVNVELDRNAIHSGNKALASNVIPAVNVYGLALNDDDVAVSFADFQTSLIGWGQYLSDAEEVILKNSIEAYMDSNGKGVIT